MLQRIAIAGSCLILTLSLAFALGAQTPAEGLTAQQIVDKNVAARGGFEPWRAVGALSMSGKMDAGGNEQSSRSAPRVRPANPQQSPKRRAAEQVQLPFRMELKRVRKSRFEIDFQGQTAIQVYDGTNGWKLRPFLNRREVEAYSQEELKAASAQSDLDGPLVDYASKGTKVERDGTEKVEGKDTYRLKLTLNNGQVVRAWIDAQTFLEVKIDGTPRRLDGKDHSVQVYYRDYQSVNGLVMPFLVETKVQGVPQTEKIVIDRVTVNPPLNDSRFAKL